MLVETFGIDQVKLCVDIKHVAHILAVSIVLKTQCMSICVLPSPGCSYLLYGQGAVNALKCNGRMCKTW